MSRYEDLLNKIKRKDAKVAVIGLGYIGLPTALFYAMRGMHVMGIDTNAALVDELKRGKISIHEEGLNECRVDQLLVFPPALLEHELSNTGGCPG